MSSALEALVVTLTDEQKAQLMAVLQASTKQEVVVENEPLIIRGTMSPEEVVKQEIQTVPRAIDSKNCTAPTRRGGNPKARVPVKAKKNTWVDDGEDAKDVITPDYIPSDRSKRPPPKKATFTCSVCNKPFVEEVSLIFGDFPKCNRCGTRGVK